MNTETYGWYIFPKARPGAFIKFIYGAGAQLQGWDYVLDRESATAFPDQKSALDAGSRFPDFPKFLVIDYATTEHTPDADPAPPNPVTLPVVPDRGSMPLIERPVTAEELSAILNSQDDRPVKVNLDGTVVLTDAQRSAPMVASKKLDTLLTTAIDELKPKPKFAPVKQRPSFLKIKALGERSADFHRELGLDIDRVMAGYDALDRAKDDAVAKHANYQQLVTRDLYDAELAVAELTNIPLDDPQDGSQ